MVVPTEKATRLPIRKDSFADMDDQNTIPASYYNSISNESEFSVEELKQENETLRRRIQDLKAQLNLLRKQQKATPGVVLELPRAMKTPTLPALNCLRKSVSKDHQSLATDDDQSTIEPSADLDVHESARGLKNRQSQPKPKRQLMVSSPADTTRRTEPLSSNDGSLSSEEDDLDESGKNNQVNFDGDDDNDVSYDDNDDEGEIDIESRQLLHTISEGRTASTRTTVTTVRSMGEEPFWRAVSDRAGWLVGLLVLQSMSSFILARNEALLQKHLVIIRFLTMLVGAGGNAGNQASVRVIRGLAIGSINDSNTHWVLKREFFMGCALSMVLALAGCLRAAVFMTPLLETLAITTSLFMIVIISIILGAMMPLGMKCIGIDPAHSSTTIQVVMDILGVSITVWMSALVLDSGFQHFLLSPFTDAR